MDCRIYFWQWLVIGIAAIAGGLLLGILFPDSSQIPIPLWFFPRLTALFQPWVGQPISCPQHGIGSIFAMLFQYTKSAKKLFWVQAIHCSK